MFEGVFNAYELDTTPGNTSSPFAPTRDWTGDEASYLQLLRDRYRSSPLFRRLMVAVRAERRNAKLTISGPYRQAILDIIANIKTQSADNPYAGKK
jgi:hypothetical protein